MIIYSPLSVVFKSESPMKQRRHSDYDYKRLQCMNAILSKNMEKLFPTYARTWPFFYARNVSCINYAWNVSCIIYARNISCIKEWTSSFIKERNICFIFYARTMFFHRKILMQELWSRIKSWHFSSINCGRKVFLTYAWGGLHRNPMMN